MKIKICGLTNLEDAELATELGATHLGFIFYPKSPRYVEPLVVREITSKLRGKAQFVGVFVNAPALVISEAARVSGIKSAQLHGDETPADCQKLPFEVIKAFRPKTPDDLAALVSFAPFAQSFLIDAAVPGEFGGTGKLANWDLAIAAKNHGPIFLSGGLTSENIAAALETVRPYGVDVSSGVEELPGKKSPAKLENFFKNIKGAPA